MFFMLYVSKNPDRTNFRQMPEIHGQCLVGKGMRFHYQKITNLMRKVGPALGAVND